MRGKGVFLELIVLTAPISQQCFQCVSCLKFGSKLPGNVNSMQFIEDKSSFAAGLRQLCKKKVPKFSPLIQVNPQIYRFPCTNPLQYKMSPE